jgi:hypothetical protein
MLHRACRGYIDVGYLGLYSRPVMLNGFGAVDGRGGGGHSGYSNAERRRVWRCSFPFPRIFQTVRGINQFMPMPISVD